MDSLVSLVRSATAVADDGADRPSITLEPGEVLLRRGDPSDAIYRVESGTLDVIAPTEHGDDVDGEVIARLGPGSHVGELGVLMGAPRSATVRAGSAPASVAEVSVAEFRRARTSLG